MSVNVSVITTASVDITEATVEGYKTNVAAHVYGDWGAHNEVKVYPEPYYQSAGEKVSDYTLRMKVSDHSGNEITVKLPCFPTSTAFSSTGVPFVLQQPQSQTATVGQEVRFSVTVASPTLASYNWLYAASGPLTVISPAQTNAEYVIPSVTVANAGTYGCLVINAAGGVIAGPAILTVNP